MNSSFVILLFVIAAVRSYIFYNFQSKLFKLVQPKFGSIFFSANSNILNTNESDVFHQQFERNFHNIVQGTRVDSPNVITNTIDWSGHERRLATLNELQYIKATMDSEEILGNDRDTREKFEDQLIAQSRNEIDNIAYGDNDEDSTKINLIVSKIQEEIQKNGYEKPAYLDTIWKFDNNSNVVSSRTMQKSVSMENINKLLLQGPPIHNGPFCPVCSLPTTDQELEDFNVCTICKQQELSEPDVHLSIRYAIKDKKFGNTAAVVDMTTTAFPTQKVYVPKKSSMLRPYQELTSAGSIHDLDPDEAAYSDNEDSLEAKVAILQEKTIRQEYELDSLRCLVDGLMKRVFELEEIIVMDGSQTVAGQVGDRSSGIVNPATAASRATGSNGSSDAWAASANLEATSDKRPFKKPLPRSNKK